MLFKLPESSESPLKHLSTSTSWRGTADGEPPWAPSGLSASKRLRKAHQRILPLGLCFYELMAKIEAKKTRSIQIHELKIVWFVLIFPIIPAVAQHHISKGLHKLTHCPFEKVQRTSVMWSEIGVSARSKEQFLNGLIPHGTGSWSRKTFKGFPLNLCLDGIWIGVWSQIEVGFNMF